MLTPIQSDYCLICSSLNKIHIDEDSEAWECWNCQAKYWIDDLCKLAYMIDNDITIAKEANKDLNFDGERIPFFALVEQ